jgi:hypothetical protein
VEVAQLVKAPTPFIRRVVEAARQPIEGDDHAVFTASVTCKAIIVSLHPAGWELHNQPGMPIVLEKQGVTFEPWTELQRVIKSGDEAAWSSTTARLGIAEIALA